MKINRQSGSAHVVVIVCLALALAVALGWIFYQNFVQNATVDEVSNYEECIKSPGSLLQESYPEVCVTKDNKHFVNPDQKIEETAKPDFVITQWGVGADYDSSKAGNLIYAINTNNGIQSAAVTSESILKEDAHKCNYGASGTIVRYTSDDVLEGWNVDTQTAKEFFSDRTQEDWKMVGEYYYWYQSPQALCGDDQDAEIAASSAVKQIVLDLEEVKD